MTTSLPTLLLYGSANTLYLYSYLIATSFPNGLPFTMHLLEDPSLQDPPLFSLDTRLWHWLKNVLPSPQNFLKQSEAMICLGRSYEGIGTPFYYFDTPLATEQSSSYLHSLRHWYAKRFKNETPLEYWQFFYPHFLSVSFNSFPFYIEKQELISALPHGLHINPLCSQAFFKKALIGLGAKVWVSKLIDKKVVQSDKKGFLVTTENKLQLSAHYIIDLSSFSSFSSKDLLKKQQAYRWAYLELPYPNALKASPSMTSHFIPSPSGYILLHPFLNSLGVSIYCPEPISDEKLLQELSFAIKSPLPSSLKGPFSSSFQAGSSSWHENTLFLNPQVFPSYLGIESRLSWAQLQNLVANFPSFPLNPYSKISFEKKQKAYLKEFTHLHDIFLKFSSFKSPFSALAKSSEYFEGLALSYGHPLLSTALDATDYDHFLYGPSTSRPYSPFPYVNESYWQSILNTNEQKFNNYSRLCQQQPPAYKLLRNLQNSHHATFF